jgi:hypothetical protein
VPSSATIERIRAQAQQLVIEQRTLVTSLLKLREHLGGSLIVRWAECGKEGCACHEGERHGPYYVLSTRSGGKGDYRYLQQPQVARARGLVDRHRRFQDGLKRLRQINQELVSALRRYREAAGLRGVQALRQSLEQKVVV